MIILYYVENKKLMRDRKASLKTPQYEADSELLVVMFKHSTMEISNNIYFLCFRIIDNIVINYSTQLISDYYGWVLTMDHIITIKL